MENKKMKHVKRVLSDELKEKTKLDQKIFSNERETGGGIWSGKTNKLTREFIENRFVVLRNFIPKDIITMTLDTWKTIENNPNYNSTFFSLEDDIIHDSPKDTLQKSEGCYCFPPAVGLHRWLRDNLRGVIDLRLRETYSYTRKYTRGAYLKAHTDRPACEISTTICLDYKTDDNTPWKIWVQNDRDYLPIAGDQENIYNITQGAPKRDKKGISVSLEPGDVLLYQGPNIPHWRERLLGDYSYHMFLHFYNEFSEVRHLDGATYSIKPSVPKPESRCVLDYDGRRNRWDTTSDEDRVPSRVKYLKWLEEVWGPLDNKHDFLNTYPHFIFKDNNDDSIQQEED